MPKRATATSFGEKAGNPRNTTKPGTGRPPKTFQLAMQSLAERNATVSNVSAILDDPSHPQFMKALEFATDRGFGKVPQKQEFAGALEVRVKIVREARRVTAS